MGAAGQRNQPEIVELGAAIRARRRELGVKLHELAAKSGLSVPFLSQVETGFAAPSLVSMFSIARCLDTTPERLLVGPRPGEIVVTRVSEGTRYEVTDSASSAVRRQLTGRDEPFSAAEYIVEPGQELGDFNSSSGREVLHVLAGRLAVDIHDSDGVAEHVLSVGDTIAYSTSSMHRWRHLGRGTTRFLVIVNDR